METRLITMSKKKSKKPAPVPGQVKDDSLRSLEEKIQNDIRSMYHKNGIIKRMDRNAIKYRYLAIHPKESEFIRQVVNRYVICEKIVCQLRPL